MLNVARLHAKDDRTMPLRLLVGLLKGAFVGALVGFGLAKLGFVAPSALFAYVGIVVVGALVGLVAGKPIWAEGARIEAGMKAFAGAVLGLGLLWAVRRWGSVPLPFSLGELSQPNASLGETAANGTLGGLAVSSYAIVAALLGGFFEADNTPDQAGQGSKAAATATTESAKAPSPKKRVAPTASTSTGDPELDALLAEDEAPPPDRKARR
jgi:hypothetical protein